MVPQPLNGRNYHPHELFAMQFHAQHSTGEQTGDRLTALPEKLQSVAQLMKKSALASWDGSAVCPGAESSGAWRNRRPGFIRIDSEGLVVKFGPDGRARARIARY